MKSVLRERLSERIGMGDIREICLLTSGMENDRIKNDLFSLIKDSDDRVDYNALWISNPIPRAESAFEYLYGLNNQQKW